MKIFLFLMLSPIAAYSQNLTPVFETAIISAPIQTIYVTSQTAINVASTTANGIQYGAYAIEVYNVSGSSNTINCGNTINVSTVPYVSNYGREIAPGVGMVWHVLQGALGIFCKTQSVTGPTPVTITQLQ